jgi:hypothetical protein
MDMNAKSVPIAGSWLIALSCIVALPGSAADDTANTTVTPAPRQEAWWIKQHEAKNERLKKGDVDLIFLGDSITQHWEGAGHVVWQKQYGGRKAVNLGIGGDRTEHVLWRLDHADFSTVKPKLVVLMIGTNNARYDATITGEEIGEGIKAVVAKLREKLPETNILLLAVFPRDEGADSQLRIRLAKANEIASKTADDKTVFFHRLEVSQRRRHTFDRHHARLFASLPKRLRNLGRGDRADGKGVDERMTNAAFRRHCNDMPSIIEIPPSHSTV